jgi:dipeptidase E
MRLLLTSNGITNLTIRRALEELLARPVGEAAVTFIPTAIYAMPDGGSYGWEVMQEQARTGWGSVNILELTALPSLDSGHWVPALEQADAILVGGGNTPYLSFWMQESGLAGILPELLHTRVYVGMSAGSIVAAHSMHVNRPKLEKTGIYDDDQYGDSAPIGAGSDTTLGLVPFTVRPHLDADYFEHVTAADMQRQARLAPVPLYAIDDQTAIVFDDGRTTVVSEGRWRLFDNSHTT